MRGSLWSLCFYGRKVLKKVIAYIDGFNLYYGSLKGTPYKWLDLSIMLGHLLGDGYQIVKIKFFTAKVKQHAGDTTVHLRQSYYLRALQAYIPNIEICYGYFSRHSIRMPNAFPPPNMVQVIKTEEKGSDVNLAVHMLNDAWLNTYDCAVLVSNDTDMSESLNLIKRYHPNKQIGIITPGNRGTAHILRQHADFIKQIRQGVLKNSQLPDNIPNTNIKKPSEW